MRYLLDNLTETKLAVWNPFRQPEYYFQSYFSIQTKGNLPCKLAVIF